MFLRHIYDNLNNLFVLTYKKYNIHTTITINQQLLGVC